jgi:hypothetical protein
MNVGDRMMKRLLWIGFFVFSFGLQAQVIQKQWVETYSWQGFGTVSTDRFLIFGKDWRIRYKTLNNGPLSVTLHDLESGQATLVMNRNAGRILGFEQYKFTTGEKFLHILGSLGGWRVSVEQYVDSVEEWNYLRYVKQKPVLEKCAAWAGESSREFSYQADKTWKLEFEQLSDGLLQVQVLDATGKIAYDSLTSKSGIKGEGWIYAPGAFTVKVSTSDVAWRLSALTVVEETTEADGQK